jgi:hypothetical protein
MNIVDLSYFIKERVEMALRRGRGEPPPWTADTILRTYRFCNVYREWDPVSEFIADWLGPYAHHCEARVALARYINEPRTLKTLGPCSPWEPAAVLANLNIWRSSGNRVFNPAYIVSTNGIKQDKLEYVVELVTRVHEEVHLSGQETLSEAANMFQAVRGVGSFMAGQMVADLKQQPVLANAEDWWTWCTPGPGSQRGLNRVMDRPLKFKWPPQLFRETLVELSVELIPVIQSLPKPLDAQNLQNCLCEFDKWSRAKNGEGTPKQIYTPTSYRNGN